MDMTQNNPNNGPNGRETMPNDNGKIDPFSNADGKISTESENPKNGEKYTSAKLWATGDEILGRYKVIELLGHGGMGVVYRCMDTVGNVEVAVKALPPEVSHSTAEMEEVRDNYNLVSKLVHKNIAVYKTLEMDTSTGDYYLIMEYVGGENLRHWMKHVRKDGKVLLETALPVLRQIAEALDYAHGQEPGVIHRDMKPDNVKILTDGTIKVLDFGLAAQIRTSQAHVSKENVASAGTPLYKSPEQWGAKSRQGASTDQYSLAVMAYEMLAGHVPFESDDRDLLKAAVLKDKPELIDGMPKYVNDALQAGLAKEASGRYVSCMDFVRALGGEKVKPKGCGTPKKKGNKWLLISSAVIIMILCAVSIWYFFSREVVDENYKRLIEELMIFYENEYDKNWDTAQTVGNHMKAFQDNYDSGMKTNAAGHYKDAYEFLLIADKEREWLSKNIQMRSKAIDLRANVDKEIKKAQEIAEKYASSNWELAKKQYEAANIQLENGEFEESCKGFENAKTKFTEAAEKAKASRIQELKNKADESRSAASAEMQQAQNEKAEEYVSTDWKLATEQYEAANVQLEKGEFDKAYEEFENAKSKFMNSADKAKKIQNLIKDIDKEIRNNQYNSAQILITDLQKLNHNQAKSKQKDLDDAKMRSNIEQLLNQANTALNNEQWQLARDKANEILRLSQDNGQAQEIKHRAENELKPRAEIIATIDGKDVIANIDYEGKKYTTPLKYNQLKTGGRLEGNLSCHYNGADYKGDFAENVNWTGFRRIYVPLKIIKPRNIFNGTVMLPGDVELQMVKIKAGNFMMGSPENEPGRYGDERQHRVTLTNDYWLGKYEVTQKQWEVLMGTTIVEQAEKFKPGEGMTVLGIMDKDYPMYYVSWSEAIEFCEKLTGIMQKSGNLPDGYIFTLPTEAQWEYACRADTNTALYNGNINILGELNAPDLNEIAWYAGNSSVGYENFWGWNTNTWKEKQFPGGYAGPRHVGEKKANAWGLHDMLGNIFELCLDRYEYNYPEGSTNPTGGKTGTIRVGRGGGWNRPARDCRSANRNGYEENVRANGLGFRVALVLSQ